jgi:membrane dipeptidase
VLGVEGWEGWLNSSGDLERLAVLFERGVRVFGLPRLAEDQEIAVLETLAGLAQGRPIAAVDLSRLDEPALDRVLTWFEADADRPRRLVPIVARGAVAREGFAGPGVISIPKLSRLRALGGILGLGVTSPWVDDARQLLTAVELAATLPFQGRVGPQGLALATGFLEAEATLPGLGSAPEVVAWVKMALGEPLASALLFDNARALVERLAGGR